MSKQSHILMLLDNPFESDLRVEKEAIEFIKNGFSVTILCEQSADLPTSEIRKGIRVERMLQPDFRHSLRSNYKSYLKEASNLISKFDFSILHCHDIYMLMIGLQVKVHNPNVVLVYDAHEYYRGWPLYKTIPSLIGRIKGWLVWNYLIRKEKQGLDKVDLVLCPSTGLAHQFVADELTKDLPMVLRNIPQLEDTDTVIDLKQKFQLKSDEFLMVQSGNIYQDDSELEKTFTTIISIPNLHLVIIGSNARYRKMEKKFAGDVRYNQRIHFEVFDQETLYPMLRSCDFGYLYTQTHLHSAHYLGSPNRVMEYSLSGLPYVSINHALSKELNDQFGHVEFFEIHNHGKLGSALNTIIKDLPQRKRMAALIKSKISWNSEMAPVIQKFHEFLDQNPKS